MKTSKTLMCTTLAILVALPAARAAAQTVSAAFSGSVKDASGAVVANADVTLTNMSTGWLESQKSRANGSFQFPVVPTGRYRLSAQRQGFAETVIEGLDAGVNHVVSHDLTLRVAAVATTVDVAGVSDLVQKTRSDLGSTVKQDVIQALPVDSREVMNLAYFAPGVFFARRGFGYDQIVEFGVGAGMGQDNAVTVGGGSLNDPTIGFADVGPPQEAIEEFKFLTGRYGAEFGGGSGGAVNMVFRSGTNQPHGSLFSFLRHEALAANDPFSKSERDPMRRADFGGTFGGPIRHDKAHAFFTFEGTRFRQTQTIDTAGTRPELEGPLPIHQDNNRLVAKIDSKPSPAHSLTTQYLFLGVRQTDFPFGLPAQSITQSSRINVDVRQDSVLFGDQWKLSDNGYNESRAHLFRSDLGFTPNGTNPWEVRPSSFAGSFPFMPQRRTDYRFQVSDSFMLYRPHGQGGHLFKIGGELQGLWLEGSLSQYSRGAFFFETDDRFNPTDAATYPVLQIQGYVQDYTRRIWQTALFAGDDWQVNDRLTLNLGLRYDVETGSTNSDIANPVPFLAQPRLDLNNVSPRAGFAYRLGKDWAVLRGGYGRYTNRLYAWLANARQVGGTKILTFNPPYQGRSNPNGTSTSSQATLSGTDPDIALPYTHQYSIGIDLPIGHSWAVAADFVGIRGRDEILQIEANPASASGVRPHPDFGPVPAFASLGHSNYRGLQMWMRGRTTSRGSINIAYTLSRSRNDHDYFFDTIQSVEDLKGREGPALNDTRHRLAVNGIANLPWALVLSGIITLTTAQPVKITSGIDANGDDVLDFPPGIERNGKRGEPYRRVDIRLTRPFTLGRATLEPMFEAYNLFNTKNVDPDTIVGNQLSPEFGKGGSTLNPLYIPRQAQFGLRVRF